MGRGIYPLRTIGWLIVPRELGSIIGYEGALVQFVPASHWGTFYGRGNFALVGLSGGVHISL